MSNEIDTAAPGHSQTADHGDIALAGAGLSKAFAGVAVLHDVEIELRRGEVHALVGENGAGKSTLVNILSGRLQPDHGEIRLNGNPVQLRDALAARKAGISIIAQELEIVPTLTVAENIFLGREPVRFRRLIDWPKANRRAKELLGDLGVEVPPATIAQALPVGDKQLVEIARAMATSFSVLIMDEPTSALNVVEAGRLQSVVRRMRDQGAAILYVSHHLNEIIALADRVTVLRDGAVCLRSKLRDLGRNDIVSAMLGRETLRAFEELEEQAHRQPQRPSRPSMPAARSRRGAGRLGKRPAGMLDIQHASAEGLFNDVSISSIDHGEIVGLAGVVGSGRTELLEAVAGLRRLSAGEFHLAGERFTPSSPHAAHRAGVCLLPEDRRGEGLFPSLSVLENILLAAPPQPAGNDGKARWLSPLANSIIRSSAERASYEESKRSLDLRAADPNRPILTLSGGNQQKALFARSMLLRPRVLLLCEPTRGVDVGAKEEIYHIIVDLARRQGVTVLMSSTEVPEIVRLTNRCVMMRHGNVVGELSGSSIEETVVLNAILGL